MLNLPKMTANNAPSPYVASASTEYNAIYAAWLARNGVYTGTDYWNTAAGNPANSAWWKLYVGTTPIRIDTLVIYNHATYGINNFKIQGSTNDSDFTDIYTGQAVNNDNKQTFTFTLSGEYNYFRLWCVDGYSTEYLVIREIELENNIQYPSCYLCGRRDRLNTRAVSSQNQLAS